MTYTATGTVAPTAGGTITNFAVVTPEDVNSASSAAYHPVHFAQVVRYIIDNKGRYSITALPCFAKALRLLQKENPVLQDRIKFVIGIVCGGLKTANYADFIANQYREEFESVCTINFRYKLPEKKFTFLLL